MPAAFVKRRVDAPPDFFAAEATGLRWLAEAMPHGGPCVSAVLAVSHGEIQIERIDTAPWTTDTDEAFGRALAAMHELGASTFGAPADGYIGPLPLDNTPALEWADFYVTRRVEPYLRQAVDEGSMPLQANPTFERLFARIKDIAGPAEPPSRIHGDLWRGNVLADSRGHAWVIDPAAHGGHRETDLAMMRLFGGFGTRCHAAYQEAWPLSSGHEDRVALHQLHPLLVHAVLFGGGYGAEALRAARHYVA
jgi:fructosamine-3-kinase